jgi:hypothetical protein
MMARIWMESMWPMQNHRYLDIKIRHTDAGFFAHLSLLLIPEIENLSHNFLCRFFAHSTAVPQNAECGIKCGPGQMIFFGFRQITEIDGFNNPTADRLHGTILF